MKEKSKNTSSIVEETTNTEGKVGTMLRDVRTKKKIAIEDAAENLRIKQNYLIAIEENDYDNIPKAPYNIGFVRSYATYLGLNSERITQIYKEEISETRVTSDISPVTNEKIADESETLNLNSKYIYVSIGLLFLCYLLWVTFNPNNISEITSETEITDSEQDQKQTYPLQIEDFTEETENKDDASESKEIPQITVTDDVFVEENETPLPTEKKINDTETKTQIISENPPKEIQAKTPTVSPQETEPKTKKTGRVVLKIKKETWVEVKDDNKLWISKVLHAGDEYVLPENGEGKTVSFGNTDGVDVEIDGKVVTVISNNKKTNINMDAFLGNH